MWITLNQRLLFELIRLNVPEADLRYVITLLLRNKIMTGFLVNLVFPSLSTEFFLVIYILSNMHETIYHSGAGCIKIKRLHYL